MSMKRLAPFRPAALLIGALIIGCGGPESNSPVGADQGREAGAGSDAAVGFGADRGRGGAVEGVAPNGASGRGEAAAGGAEGAEAEAAASAPDTPATILFIGTSLTAGLGLPEAQSFPLVIERRIEQEGLPFDVVNAGVSGETSAGALRRIDWLLRQDFDVVVLETGANDMLRGVDPRSTEANIQAIIDRIRGARPGATIVLAGMLSLPNMGEAYGREFEAIYPRLAERNDLPYVPFLLDGVGGVLELNQGDGVHPTAEGHRIIADTVWNVLGPVLTAAASDVDGTQ
jgi:acyl-CoA thioesterase-1